MKKIISRRLPLDVRYTVIAKEYIPVLDGFGCTCDNCGKLIANIATVKSENGTYRIGFDCLETFLLNNNVLDGFDAKEYESRKQQIGKIIRLSKKLKEVVSDSASNGIKITGFAFDRPSRFNDLGIYTFFWLRDNLRTSRDNDYIKVKDVDFDFLLSTLRNIFPNFDIFIKE